MVHYIYHILYKYTFPSLIFDIVSHSILIVIQLIPSRLMSYLWPMARTVPMITMVPMVCMFPMIPLVSDYVPCGPHIVSMVHMAIWPLWFLWAESHKCSSSLLNFLFFMFRIVFPSLFVISIVMLHVCNYNIVFMLFPDSKKCDTEKTMKAPKTNHWFLQQRALQPSGLP